MKKITNIGGRVPGLFADMLVQPHVLIAGASGSGKSVLLNGLICSILRYHPNAKQMILIDPKRTELNEYADMPHTLQHATEPGDIVSALEYTMQITENRYNAMQCRRERLYNGADVYVIIDEFADLMTTNKRQTMPTVQRLCQIGRAAKVHIILATQCPLAKILPTEIKVNFTAICGLHTRSRQDSRNIIGCPGCENLPRFGRCLYLTPEGFTRNLVPYTSDADILAYTDFYRKQGRPFWRRAV